MNITALYKAKRFSGDNNTGKASICYKTNGAGIQNIEEDYEFNYFDTHIQLLSTIGLGDDNGPIGHMGSNLNGSNEIYYFPLTSKLVTYSYCSFETGIINNIYPG